MTLSERFIKRAPVDELAADVGAALGRRRFMLASAESCTGGGIGAAVTSISGSSAWFDRGFITYSNEAKREMLGVADATLARFGEVSEQTVAEMAQGALERSGANISVAVSGIAGPAGGTPEKPVGTVCFAWCLKGEAPISETWQLSGDRDEVRAQAVEVALQGVLELLEPGSDSED